MKYKYMIRNDQYGHGKRSDFIIVDPEFFKLGDQEDRRKIKFLQVIDKLKYDIQQNDNLYYTNYPTTNACRRKIILTSCIEFK